MASNEMAGNEDTGRFDIAEVAARLPETADSMLADEYMTDRQSASARVFRVYKPVPAHYHEGCDEYLYVFKGRGTFWMKDAANEAEFAPGQLICFDRKVVHAIPRLIETPVIFLAIDTPRRAPEDVHFVDEGSGDAQSFMARNA